MRQWHDETAHVVDEHRISVAHRHSVLDVLTLRMQGCIAEKIKGKLEQSAYDSTLSLLVWKGGISEKGRPSDAGWRCSGRKGNAWTPMRGSEVS